MITDKDREELKELTKQIRKSNQTMQWFDYGWDDCAEILMRYVEKKSAESAEQARKEADEKLAIAVKALEVIRDNALNPAHTMTTLGLEQVIDANRAISDRALKEIQG